MIKRLKHSFNVIAEFTPVVTNHGFHNLPSGVYTLIITITHRVTMAVFFMGKNIKKMTYLYPISLI